MEGKPGTEKADQEALEIDAKKPVSLDLPEADKRRPVFFYGTMRWSIVAINKRENSKYHDYLRLERRRE